MRQCWIIIYIATTIMMANGHVEDLLVNVIPVESRFASVQDVNVILKYSNIGDDTMSIYKWYLPEKGLYDPLFEVTRDGERVEYVGPLCKRRAPTADDVIFLAPGTTVSAAIQLSTVYDMTRSGNYIIQYKMNADQVVFTTDGMRKHKIASSNIDEESVLESPPIAVFVVGRRNLLIEQAIEANTQVRALTPTYSGCSTSQTSALSTATNAAESLADNAVVYLNNGQSSARYTTWFGAYSSGNWAIAKSHFTKIQSALKTKTLSFDCTCSDAGTYAYVYANEHYKIYLCGAYWPSVATGIDSKSGTIIHELAHFTILAGTTDHAYGQSTCKSLAQSNPAKALMNSDNLQYFVEDEESTTTRPPTVVISNYSSTLTVNGPMFSRPGGSSSGHYYKAIQIIVSTNGTYNLMSSSSMDTYGYLYQGSFYPLNPSVNELARDDDTGGSMQFKLTAFLVAGVSYTLVVTTHGANVNGPFSVVVSGPAGVTFIPINTVTTTTTSTTTRPAIITSNYPSTLTVNGPTYSRPGGSSPDHHYKAIQIIVSTTGTYNLMSSSSMDTYGSLYQGSFYPLNPSSNLLAQDDDNGGNSQFKLASFLRPDMKYILVVTTYSERTTGPFSIAASGPGDVNFVLTSNT